MDCCLLQPTSLRPKTPPHPSPSHKLTTLLRAHSTRATPQHLSLTTTSTSDATASSSQEGPNPDSHSDESLLALLKLRKTEQAWITYTHSLHLPSSTCLSRLVAQLSYQATPAALARARSIVRRLRDEGQLQRLDANSLGLLAVAASKCGATNYAVSVIKTMLRSSYLPHVKAWSAVVSRLAASPDDGPAEALRLYELVVARVRALAANSVATEATPDTAAFNAVLNACANIGDVARFVKLFDEMPEFGAEPDALTYNVMIKLCARAGRKNLLVYVLERIIHEGIVPCTTTMHSLVAAYVGFNDIKTAERLVQSMREGRRNLCQILRGEKSEDPDGSDGILDKLVMKSNSEPPLLPKTYAPDSRIYTTLMKGYMKEGRVNDVVQLLEAMRQEKDGACHPDQVTYTTVVSALVKAGSMDRARHVLSEMARAGVHANRITYNVLLKGYCQQFQIDQAKEMAREMVEEAGIKLDVVSYNILLDGCILVDDNAGALKYFNEMRERGIAPSKVSYTTLMKAFASTGQPKLVQKVFDEMTKDRRVRADLVAWNMLVEGYCKLGLVEEAKKVIEKMKENGFYPDVSTYCSLANGIALARKPGEALLLWNEIKDRCRPKEKDETASGSSSLPPLKPDEGLLDTLADVCVRAAFFQKALEIVACMEENGISPNKTKYKRIYVEMHSKMFTSKHASKARQDRRSDRKRAAEAFKFWLGLPNSYYGSEWRLEPAADDYASGL